MIDAANPYMSPQVPGKLDLREAADPKHRDIALFVLLMFVTLGFYWFYLAYQWAKELNGLEGRVKYQPLAVLLVSIFSCGIAGIVFESLFAFDLAEHARARNVPRRMEQIGMWVLVCNVVGIAISFIPFGFVIGFPLCALASVLVQVELNKLAEVYAGIRPLPA